MQIRKTTKKLHLWLGLSSAIIVFTVCLTGSLFVFSDEIINLSARKASKVIPEKEQLTIDEMIDTVKQIFPNHLLLHCINYKDKGKAALFAVANKVSGPFLVFVNPYNGQITGRSGTIKLFSFLGHFHKQLLLGKCGSWIVLIASVIFVLELITGLVMWSPYKKSKKYLKNSLTIKRDTKSLRKVIDLHRVLGLYFIVVLLLLSITGVVLFFLPQYGIEAQKPGLHAAELDTTQQALPLASIISQQMKNPDVTVVKTELWNIDKSNEIQCIAGNKIGVATFTGKPYLINKYTGAIIEDAEILTVIETRNIFRKLHLGDWWGWFGKSITFLTGLIGAFLAITAPIIWWQKKQGKIRYK